MDTCVLTNPRLDDSDDNGDITCYNLNETYLYVNNKEEF